MIPEANGYLFMTQQDKIPEFIDKFNNDELSGAELTEFLELLRQSPELRAEVKLDKELNEILLETDILELRKKIIKVREGEAHKGSGRRIFLIAASVLVFISLSVALFLIFGSRERNDQPFRVNLNDANNSMINQKDTAKKARGVNKEDHLVTTNNDLKENTSTFGKRGTENLVAANYAPFPAYENLVDAHFRSGDFRLIIPASVSRFHLSDSIQFKWESGVQHDLRLSIMDNKGNMVFESDHLSWNFLKVKKGSLKKGLFYFKFLNDNEIILFGKFIIE
ncbi:MAG: hypothetical protein NTX61_14170 [Bacteroidetes bacterium]|nr:hypothetical protein [Bacteroidota bacterium]